MLQSKPLVVPLEDYCISNTEGNVPSPVTSLAAISTDSHFVSYPMQYRVLPRMQAIALLTNGALKLELVHTL